MTRWAAPLILLLTGCPGTDTVTSGRDVLWEHFPFDGNRTWEFRSDSGAQYEIVATTRPDDPENELSDEDTNVYWIDFTVDCVGADPECVDGEFIKALAFSSDVRDGVQIHAYDQGNSIIPYDPPLLVTPKDNVVGEVTQTNTDNSNWSSTLMGYQPCTDIVRMQGTDFERANCAARFVIEDGDNDPDTNSGVTGDLWVARGIGFVGFSLEGQEEVWGLSSLVCEPDEECNGEW